MDNRFPNWCFTSYRDPDPIYEKIQYMVYQKEMCPSTKREHWQGYVEFKEKVSMKTIKRIFDDETLHLEVRKGNQKQAIDYCTKKDTRISDPVHYGMVKNQGHRKDLDEIYDDIEEGMTAREILVRHKGNGLRHINLIKKGLMVFHNLDMVDKHILQQRGEAVETKMEDLRLITKDKQRETQCNEPDWSIINDVPKFE